jgi:hypothetical protein
MPLDDLVNVTITTGTRTPTRPGFGTILIAVAKVPTGFTDFVRQYSSLGEMVDDGFTSSDPAYKIAQKLSSQNPRPRFWKIGRRATAFSQKVSLTPSNTTEGYVYSFLMNGTEVTFTVGAAAAIDDVADGIAAAIEGTTGISGVVTAVSLPTGTGGTHVEVTTDTAGSLIQYSAWDNAISFKDITSDPGLEDDLDDIADEDSDFYGLLLDSNSAAEVTAASAWANSNRKLFGFDSTDTLVVNAGNTTDIFSTQKALNPAWTYGVYKKKDTQGWLAAAWMGNRFPFDPGSDTWKFKTLSGVAVDNLTGGEIAAIESKRGNYYITVAGLATTANGMTFSGEWIDVTRGVDWLRSEIQIREFAMLMNNQKVPYTETGVDMVKAVLQGCLQDGIRVGLLAASPEPQIITRPVSEIDAVTKASRLLPDVNFTATLAGAIHQLEINGFLSA